MFFGKELARNGITSTAKQNEPRDPWHVVWTNNSCDFLTWFTIPSPKRHDSSSSTIDISNSRSNPGCIPIYCWSTSKVCLLNPPVCWSTPDGSPAAVLCSHMFSVSVQLLLPFSVSWAVVWLGNSDYSSNWLPEALRTVSPWTTG